MALLEICIPKGPPTGRGRSLGVYWINVLKHSSSLELFTYFELDGGLWRIIC